MNDLADRRFVHDRFFRVPRTVHRTSAGLVDLPILYFDATNVVALFEADRGGAEALLAGTGLVPAMIRGDRAVVGLSFYEYRHTSVGVYNEVGTAIFAARRGDRVMLGGLLDLYRAPARRTVGAYVVDLPVTTEAANAAGRELWGYPKFVTRIDVRLAGRRFDGTVFDPDGAEICTLAGNAGFGVPVPPVSLVTFTQLSGQLVRTPIDVRAPTRAHGPGDLALRVGSSRHPMADNLRRLGLDGAAPRLVLSTTRFQSKLWAGSRLPT